MTSLAFEAEPALIEQQALTELVPIEVLHLSEVSPDYTPETSESEKRNIASRAFLGAVAMTKDLTEDLKTFWRAGAEDIRDASWRKRLIVAPIVGISAVAMAFDLPFHETYLGKIGTHEFIESHGSTLRTGLANGIASLSIEGLIALGITVGIKAMPKFTGAIADRYLRKSKNPSKPFGGPIDRSTYLLSYGSGAYTFKQLNEKEEQLKKKTRDPLEEPGKKKSNVLPNIATAIGAAAFLGVSNTGIGAGLARVLDYGERHPEYRQFSIDTVNLLKGTLFWLGFVGLRVGVKKALSLRRKDAESVNEESPNIDYSAASVSNVAIEEV